MSMIDFHTHSLLSDGVLLPCELARRAEEISYKAIGITDHVDASNIDFIVPRIIEACKDINKNWKIKAIPGVELSHMPIESLPDAVRFVRSKGINLVLIHGETLAEPVIPGTNRKAIECDIDILTHPGLISVEEAKLAAQNGVYLEITTRLIHSLTNGHVARVALSTGAKLILNTDAHQPEDLITEKLAKLILLGAGLNEKEATAVFKNSEELLDRILRR